MTTSPASGHRFQTLFPLALAAFLLLGTSRLKIESSCSKTRCKHVLQRVFSFAAMHKTKIKNDDGGDDEHFYYAEALRNGSCNVFEGAWVLDEVNSMPLYTEESCPYLTTQVTCLSNGRPDSLFQKWRWKPHACQLPRFDAVKLLESLRNKRLMFIGDSLQRTQWESMVCLVESAIPDSKKSMAKIPPRRIFMAEEYNASIEFYWAPFLVESNADHATKHHVQKRRVKLDSISKHSKNWEGVDVLVFESYVWWMNKPLINATTGSLEMKEYNVTTAYRLALQTLGKWLDSTMNPLTQKAFFMSLSPTHIWSWEWKSGSNGNCFNETTPIQAPYWGIGSSHQIMDAVRDTLQDLKVNVTLLNITQLSEYRKDGHTSVYTERQGKLLTFEQRSQPEIYADCVHWCLPGVPDTWNEILYMYLLYGPRKH